MNSSYTYLIPVMLLLFLQACSGRSVETITVERPAQTSGQPEQITEGDVNAIANVLRIGEVNKITGFDPLFALNPATQRVVQLVYEGLVTLDDHDEVQPAIARQWQISRDSLRYTFHLDRTVFYHDDASFGSGIGRRVRASDFKRAFERMASRDVPPNAAELFLNQISGFEAYYYEQREVYLPEERTLNQINGIRAENDSTLTFTLLEHDPDFLYKLASPFAVVYPGEALRYRERGLKDHPVGSGPFSFGGSRGDTLHIFNRNSEYHKSDESGQALPRPARVEFLNIANETEVFRQLALGNINVIMELGPSMIRSLINSDNELEVSYREQYELVTINHKEPYVVRYNPNNRLGLGSRHASSLARSLPVDSLIVNFGNPSLQLAYLADDQADASYLEDLQHRFEQHQDSRRLILAFGSDISAQVLSAQIISLFNREFNAALMDRRIFSRNIFLYMDHKMRYTPAGYTETLPQEILRFDKDRYLLIDNRTEEIKFNSYSWWLNLNYVRVMEIPS